MQTRIALACMAAVWVQQTAAQTTADRATQRWPDRPIRVIVPFPPGGSSDFAARILSQHLTRTLKHPIVIDNRSGAGGNLGTDIVAKAVPDGYTFLISAEGPIVLSPSLYPDLPYVPTRDLTAVTQVVKFANVLVVTPSLRATSVKDLIALAKAQPGKMSYAHSGVGTNVHLAAELFKLMAGVDIVGVSYKGGGPAILSVIGNETQLGFNTAPSVTSHVKSGKLRALAVTTAKRSAVLPELPTIAESGVPGYAVEGWAAFMAPAKTPPAIVARMYEETVKVLQLPEVKEAVAVGGSEIGGATPAETLKIIREESATWNKVIKKLGIKLE